MQENDEKIPDGMGKVEYYSKNPKKGTIAYYISLGLQIMMKALFKRGVTLFTSILTYFFGIEYGILVLLAAILEEIFEKPIRDLADGVSTEVTSFFQVA